uniref:CARD domain-containing protein n=1 Tax=Biomphalaria glabrata TaxID=6526 RepID=A0A2C9LWL3_BIOGL
MPPRGKLKQQDGLRLQKNHLLLKNELDALKITDFLYQKDILDRDDIERIESGKTTMERNEILLRRISNIGPGDAFDIFLDSLKEDYKHLYDALVEEPTTQAQKAVAESHCVTSNATGELYLGCLEYMR